MAIRKIPTTADIYLEVNGVRVAVVQSYKVTASRESKAIYAFGQSEPVSTIRGQSQYVLELTRLYATDEAIRDGLNFCDMDDFSLVVCKPDRNVIYTGCQWKSLQESAEVGGNVLEKVTVEAGRRIENPSSSRLFPLPAKSVRNAPALITDSQSGVRLPP